jgi:HTH-type transcriptional regulator/antitoxin HigA
MAWSIINSNAEYARAMDRVEQLSTSPPSPNSDLGKELMLLGYLIHEYESKNFKIDFPEPILAIQERMEQMGLSIADLLDIFGDRGTASKVLNYQRSLSLSMIRGLADKLGLPAELLIQPTKASALLKENAKSLVAERKIKYQKARKKTKS